MRRNLVGGYLLFCIAVVSALAQSQKVIQNQYKFKYLTIDQGLSNNNVHSICHDSKGFIWFATQNGVDKFNGQAIVHYRNDPQDSSSISSNVFNTIFLDSKKNLWFGGAGGLDLYNADLNNFIRLKHKDLDRPIGYLYSVAEDKEGKLWFGGFLGLYSYDLNTSKIQFFSIEEGNPHGLPQNSIYKLLVDQNNNVWISILNEGLWVYNQNEGTFISYKNDPEDPSTISGNRIESLYEDSKGNIWAGTLNEGLNMYIPESNSFIRKIPDPNETYSTRVRAIFEDLKGNFFIGTRAGLYVRNNHTGEYVHYAFEGHNFSNLSQNSILSSHIDNTGTLWIGT